MVILALLPVVATAGAWVARSPALTRALSIPPTPKPETTVGPVAGDPAPPPSVEAADAPPSANAGAWRAVTADLQRMAASTGPHAIVSIAWRETGGTAPRRYSLRGGDRVFAASTYKLPLLVETARRVSAGRASWKDSICFSAEDAEDSSFYEDYEGRCPSRQVLAERTGRYSDNTAAHMLTRDLGGPAALNAAARRMGATGSEFFDPNTTTADDLASIMESLASGRSLVPSARGVVNSVLTHTAFELGVPAGIPSSAAVVHKVGSYDSTFNDAALVTSAPAGDYTLVVLTDNVPGGEPAAWSLIKRISARIWDYESRR
ncbi:MAG: serine hydrolase [Candidatus Dormibacteria bacterium]